jgi:putative intracellular protease/amidase
MEGDKKKVLVVCARRYNGHELWVALGVMQEQGLAFEVVSADTKIFDEVTYQANVIERTLWDVDPVELAEGGQFDGLMIVSGNMKDTESYWFNDHVLAFVGTAALADKPIAAICCSVPTIRNAAYQKRVSFFPLVRSRHLLASAGAILQTVACTVDGKLVTAEHQMASQIWAEAFCDVMFDREHSINLVDSGYVPKGHERKPIPAVERIRIIQEQQRRIQEEAPDEDNSTAL